MTQQAAGGQPVELTVDGPIATLSLNRPEVRNAIDDSMRVTLIEMLDEVARTDSIRALIVTGRGSSFCSGGDISAMQERLAAPAGQVAGAGWRRQRRTHHAIAALHALEKPTIAAVNGAAMGLGCDLALCCDFVLVSDKATMGMTYVQRGLIPDGGGMYFLPRRVGLAKAKELIFTSKRLTGAEAVAIGMADRLAPAESLLEEARRWAEELTVGSATAIALAKSILDQTFELDSEEVFALGAQAQAICYTTEEHRDSIAAFLKR